MRIHAAVLEEAGRPAPYADSRPVSVCELDLDRPGPGEVLIRIEAAGICHSDLSVVDGNRPRPLPMLLGHEAAGRVVEGAAGTRLRPGQRVVMTFLPRCGQCEACATNGRIPCAPGSDANAAGTLLSGQTRLRRDQVEIHHHLGVSAFADHAVVDARSVVPVDDDVPAEVAALLGCAVLTGGGAVLNVAPPRKGQAVIVVGLGGVGMAAVLAALAAGAAPVIAVDPLPAKLRHAADLGAHACHTADELAELGITAPLVVEAAGNSRAFETAVRATAPGGTTVTVGLPGPDAAATISPLALTAGARTIVGSYLGSSVPSRDIPRYVDLWRQGVLPVEKLISDAIGLEGINAAFDRLADGSAMRQLIVFSGAER